MTVLIELGLSGVSRRCNLRKQSCGSLPTTNGIRTRLRTKVTRDEIVSHSSSEYKKSELTCDPMDFKNVIMKLTKEAE